MDISSIIQRFRSWQQKPSSFSLESKGSHRCADCGKEFEGDYCPVCGQKYDVGRMDWTSIGKDFMTVGGLLDLRDTLSFILQLFGRPGYLISDYISGRRQVCGPPLGILLMITAVTVAVLGIHGSAMTDDAPFAAGSFEALGKAYGWMISHISWVTLIQTALLIVPTWLPFRYAPRHTKHTFPEGVYIQIIMCSLVLLIVMLRSLVGDWILFLVPLYYCYAYRQLFGYGVWGTIWRTIITIGSVFLLGAAVIMTIMHFSGYYSSLRSGVSPLVIAGVLLIMSICLPWAGYLIGKKESVKSK